MKQVTRRLLCCFWSIVLMTGISVLSSYAGPEYIVSSSNITIELSREGRIVGVELGNKKIRREVSAETDLAGCKVESPVISEKNKDGGVRFNKRLTCEENGTTRRYLLTEDFLAEEGSVRWELELEGEGPPWSTAIETHLKWPEAKSAQFWTTWGDPSPRTAGMRQGLAITERIGAIEGWTSLFDARWDDPLTLRPFQDMELWYGGNYYLGGGFSVPIATLVDGAGDAGMSLVLSPRDTYIDMKLNTDKGGNITFSRLYNRIPGAKPVHFAMDLIAHEADWRPALGWMVKHYPEFFNPSAPKAEELAGAGAYSSYQGPLDERKFKEMGFRVNWNATFDFPYQGMYLPPVKKGASWTSWRKRQTSVAQMNGYCEGMEKMGFHVLSYFDVTGFGSNVQFPPPESMAPNDEDLWKSSDGYLYQKLAGSILYLGDGKPIWSGDKCILMDPASLDWHRHLLQQAERLINELPACSGIAIDVLGMLMWFNPRADDGVTWVNSPRADDGINWLNGRPVRSLTVSWKETMSQIGPMMHRSNKAIFANPQLHRLDLLQEVDGIFDEIGYLGFNLNLDAFLGVRKPVIAWTATRNTLRPDPDSYMQRHVYLGAFPMVPFPENDHSIGPDEWAEKFYLDYGPLFNAMHGRKWVLTPHVVQVDKQLARANIFEVPGGYVIPVTFGADSPEVKVLLRGLPGMDTAEYEFINPGGKRWTRVKAVKVPSGQDQVEFEVPLQRGCAMVRAITTPKN